MSLYTWQKEYYKKSGVVLVDEPVTTQLKSVKKLFEGLFWKALGKHQLKKDHEINVIRQDRFSLFVIDYNTLALCNNYLLRRGSCTSCPLYKVRKGYSCEQSTETEDISPFDAWTTEENVQPMIDLVDLAYNSSIDRRNF